MKQLVRKEKKIAMLMEMLHKMDCIVLGMELEEGHLGLSVIMECDDECLCEMEETEEEEGCPCFDPDEDDEDEDEPHCIHCCPECGTCMLGLGGEDC